MNPAQRRFILGMAGLLLLAAGSLLGILAVGWLDRGEGWWLTLGAGILVAALALWLQWTLRAYFSQARHLAEDIDIILTANPAHRAPEQGPADLKQLAQRINRTADRFQSALADQESAILHAQARLAEEKNRLAALMSELTEGVIVCNNEGQILLYNDRARQILVDRSRKPGVGGFVGLGRSIFALIDRSTIAHGLESLRYEFERDSAKQASSNGDMPQGTSTQFATRFVIRFVTVADNGQLLRTAMSPILAPSLASSSLASSPPDPSSPFTGFVLTLENVTRLAESSTRRDLLLRDLTENLRDLLANIRAAIEAIQDFPQITPAHRALFHKIIYDESVGLSGRLDRIMVENDEDLNAQWQLADILARDLLWSLHRHLEDKLSVSISLDVPGSVVPGTPEDKATWLRVDGYAVVQAFLYVMDQLQRGYGVNQARLRLGHSGRFSTLDLVWAGRSANQKRLRAWQGQLLIRGDEGLAITLDEMAERHGGQVWFQMDGDAGETYLRLLLPINLAMGHQTDPPPPDGESRPEFYDFDLFHQPGQSPELDGRALSRLAFTVFDSETTGLNIAQGDTTISISAVRIVNGRLLRHERFDQLVDPQRPLSPSAAITGITPAMLVGQPTIDRVLPQFHRFAEETVLVAHNAAFDMRLLQLQEAETGVQFTNPVLDTLLLSTVVHPDREDHSLEAIAARLGVNVVGRHTALGDALVTAEIFLKLLPLLERQNICTLKEAREAAEQSYLARVNYG